MVKKNENIVNDYLTYYEKYKKMFGKKVLILMQIGSFHEAYCTEKRGPDLHLIGNDINLTVTRKNNKKNKKNADISNPFMMGVPSVALEKYLQRLIDKNYTIVVIDQVTPPPKPKRKITGIYSPGTNLNDNSQDSNNILSIYIEEGKDYDSKQTVLCIGFTILDLTTGKLLLHSIQSTSNDHTLSLDELCKILTFFKPKEIILNTNLKKNNFEYINNYCELNSFNILHNSYFKKEFININFQNNLFQKIWNIESQLSPIEFLNLNSEEYVRTSLVVAICFAEEHNSSIIKNLNLPLIYNNLQFLKLGNDAISQLDLIKNKTYSFYSEETSYRSLFDIIDQTKTGMGKRFLYYQMLHPLLDIREINKRYDIIDKLDKDNIDLTDHLKNISDIEKMFRKMSLGTIHPRELYSIINSFEFISLLFKDSKKYFLEIKKLGKNTKKIINYFDKKYEIEELKKYLLHDIGNNIFKPNCYNDIDTLSEKKNIAYNTLQELSKKLSSFLEKENKYNFSGTKLQCVKILYSDKYGYHLDISKRRFDLLKKEIKNNKIIIKCNKILNFKNDKMIFDLTDIQIGKINKGNTLKISSLHIDRVSNMIQSCNEQIKSLCRQYFTEDMVKTYNNNCKYFLSTTNIISYIDFINSGLIVKNKFNYTKPIIKKKKKSFVDFKNVRHPIVERIINTEYVTHDISLGKTKDGILLYGLNSAGKSTIMKAIGLNIILAQMGYYSASSKMTYYPYENLLCRISGSDNLFKGLSSFHLEINELDAILNRFNKNTLVLADEVCKGTEHGSALSLVGAFIEILANEGTSFISATHLHDLAKLDTIKKLKNIEMLHIEVNYDYDNNSIIYDRILKPGSGPSEYGLEVASFLMKKKSFIKIAKKFRKEIFGETELQITKKSKYNKKVFMDKCEICLHKPKSGEIPLETHHINPQKDTDSRGFLLKLDKTHTHKNKLGNLVTLCSKCHDKIDRQDLYIYGYLDTSKGMKLISITKEEKNAIIDLEMKASKKSVDNELSVITHREITKMLKKKFGKKLTSTDIKYIKKNLNDV